MAPRNRANQAGRLVIPNAPPADDAPQGIENGNGYDPDPEPEDLGDLATLVGESFQDAVWYIYRRRMPGEAVAKSSNPNASIYVAKMVGELDIDALAKLVGGGSFTVCGYRSNRKFIQRPFEVDGPRKRLDDEPPTAPATAAPAAAPAADATASRLDKMERVLQAIEQRLTAPAPAPQLTFENVIAAAKLLKPETPPQQNADAAAVQGMVEVFKEGISLGSTREGAAGTDWGAIIEKSLPVLEKVLTGALARRGRPAGPMPPGRAVPAPPPSGSSAVVIESPAAAPEPEPQESPRMAAVVESLARQVEAMGSPDERDPADFAATVETILLPAELGMLRLTSTDRLMSELAQVSERFPILTTPQARAYVDAVLSALKNPPTDGE